MSAENALVRKLSTFIRLTPEEIRCLSELQSGSRRVARQTELVREGDSGRVAYVLQEGWAYSYKLLPDGQRQIIGFPLPGDVIGLRSSLLRTADHSLATLTHAVVSEVPARRFMEIFHDLPRLAAALLWALSRDEATVVEHLVDIGRRNALERTAHLFLELKSRLQLVGLAADDGFDCPLTQDILADALGLSVVHVNRVLRQARERGLFTLKSGRLVIRDLSAIGQIAQFDGGYLDQERRQEAAEGLPARPAESGAAPSS